MPRPDFSYRLFEDRRDFSAAEKGNIRALRRLVHRLGPMAGILRGFMPETGVPDRETIRDLTNAIRLLRPDLFDESVGFAAPPQILGGPRRVRGRRAEPMRAEPQPETLGARPLRSAPRRSPFGFRGNPDAPEYRGEMIPVNSSNVHSIGFVWNERDPSKGTLLVRFLHKSKGSAEPGARYEYKGVHPAVFDSMRRAESKGKFVWDRLRVRGTVTGHRYQYALEQLHRSGYVPRRAVRYGDREYFVGRQVTGTNTRTGQRVTFSSAKADEYVRRISSAQIVPGGRRVPLVSR